ncbi:hypothetical protein ACQP00_31045 [Dactylosporangium sp. CS-047395]|uniref:hypothetical protein n=1 Tax=Dactylosporangium sp. CS-047395 TaxID=3239936 RepID=UPI003D8EFAB2
MNATSRAFRSIALKTRVSLPRLGRTATLPRAAHRTGLNQWLALLLAPIAPARRDCLTRARNRRLDPTAVFIIATMTL